jgi:hypothetical protein
MLDYENLHSAIAELREKQIFFIGGTMKSGTTWLQLLLDAHPEVSCNGEGNFANALSPALRITFTRHNQLIAEKNETIFKELEGYPRLGDDDFRYLLASSIGLFLLRQSKQKAARAVGERSPSNLRYFDLLNSLFPRAKFIHIVRDARDCAVSGWFHNLRLMPDHTKRSHGSMEAYVLGYIDGWVKDMGLGQTFADKSPDRVRQVRYEDLAVDTDRVTADIFAFLGVDAGADVLARCRTKASFASLSGGRPPGQENLGSFFRKGTTGDWRNHLSDDLNAKIRSRAGALLDRFGYG